MSGLDVQTARSDRRAGSAGYAERVVEEAATTELFRRPYLEKLLGGKVTGLRPRRGVKIWLLVTLEAPLRALGVERP